MTAVIDTVEFSVIAGLLMSVLNEKVKEVKECCWTRNILVLRILISWFITTFENHNTHNKI